MSEPDSSSTEAESGHFHLSAALEKLEFDAIRQRLVDACHFGPAAELARELEPATDRWLVDRWLEGTAEGVDLVTNFPDITLGNPRDIRVVAERAGKGSRLLAAELLAVVETARAARLLKRSITRLPEGSSRFPQLIDLSSGLIDASSLENAIGHAIGPAGEVLDTASPALGRIRREVRVAHGRLMDRLNRFVSSGAANPALQDAIVTSRDGRYVVPVRAESRSQVPGVVHDVSASGQTLFVEPLEVVELNNRWREAQIEETREVDRILDELSHQVGVHAGGLKISVESLARIDFLMAKARLAFALRANRPTIVGARDGQVDEHGHRLVHIELRSARHPLLDPATVVPIDIELGSTYRILLITGPNTGGKTVTLKTVGLLAAMAQAGLFIPAAEGSILSVFTSFFVDIGDDQSIAQSLSTFSAHIASIIDMLDHVEPTSLVLIDEVGSGTDPVEGSALARAIILELLERGPLVIATTHYSEVKQFAYQTPGVENASVEFDTETLQPTYHVVIGVPGQSNALSIARRLGLDESILERAASFIDSETQRADDLLGEIRAIRERTARELDQARESRLEADRMRAEAAEQRAAAHRERLEARDDALAAAERELSDLRGVARRLERAQEGIERSTERTTIEDPQRELNQALRAVQDLRRASRTARTPSAPTLGVGDRVRVSSLGLEGEVASIDGETAELVLGGLRTRQPLSMIERIGGPRQERAPRTSYRAGTTFVPMEIDLRGERVADVEDTLEQYLDAAYRGNLPSVRIIHGKGTGALRQAVRRILAGHPAVDRSESGGHGEGGDGVTIAYLRE